MKTIYYLGEQLDKVWDEGDEAEVEITLTTLGRDELTITGFTGDLLEEIYFWVPYSDSNDDEIPTYEWKKPNQNPIQREWQFGDANSGMANSGDEIKFPYVLNDDRPTLKVKLKLVIGKSESLPSHVYVETLELGDTSAILIFRSGINPEEPDFKPNITILNNDPLTTYPDADGLGTLSPVNYEENTPNIGSFQVKNIGGENAVITSIEFRDAWWNLKDYVYFSGNTNSNDTATIASGMTEEFTIDVDARSVISDNSDPHFGQVNSIFDDIPSLLSDDENFLRTNGYINVIYNDGDGGTTSTYISIHLKLDAPIIGYDYDDNFMEGDQELNFNYKYSKVDHKVLNKKLTIYNIGKNDLIISDIDTNFSIDGTNSAVVCTTSGNITISPGGSYDFTFDITSLPSPPKELDSSGSYLSTLEELNTEFIRKLIISSNSMNYSSFGSNANRTLAYENNSGINNQNFTSSVFYDYSTTSPYYWTVMDVDSFTPPILKPLYDSIAKVDIFNYDNYNSATHPSDHFKLEVVDHSANLGTTAWLNSELSGEQAPSTQPLFIYEPDYYEESYAEFDDLATYVTVRLPDEAGFNRYHKGEPEVVANPKLEGHIRRKYDFEEDINPLKILVTKVVQNSPTEGIDQVGTIDPKDGQTTYYDTNEKLLIYIYARSRILTWDSYGILNYNNTDLSDFETTSVDKYIHTEEGILDIPSYGILNYNPKSSFLSNELLDKYSYIRKIFVEKNSYGFINYMYDSDTSEISGTVGLNKLGVRQKGSKNAFGLLHYSYDEEIIGIINPRGIIQAQPHLIDKDAFGVLHYKTKLPISTPYPGGFPDGQVINRFLKTLKVKNPVTEKSFAILSYMTNFPDVNISELEGGKEFGILKVENQTPRNSYGFINYMYKEDEVDIENPFGILQYRPELINKDSYGLLHYNHNADTGLLKGTAWYGQGASSGQYLGVSQFRDPSDVYKYSYSLINYSYKNDRSYLKGYSFTGSGKYGIYQYNPAHTYINSYSMINNMIKGGYNNFEGGELSWMNSKQEPQNINAYGMIHFNNDPFSYALIKQSTPDFNVKTWNHDYTTEDPGHDIDIGTLNLYITEWSKENIFEEAHSAHRWRINYSGWGNMELANLGNEDLIIHGVVIENNSPGRIHDLIIDQQLAIDDDPFPMTIVANDDINSSFQIVGVEDGFITGQDANETDDWYDTNSTMYPPTIKIYTNDPHPDSNDPDHVIIDDSNHPYDGLAEWTIEVTWGTTWAEDPGT